MRRAALALVAFAGGCQAIFGITDTQLAPVDAAPVAVDAPVVDGPMDDAPVTLDDAAGPDAGALFTVTATPPSLLLVRGGAAGTITINVSRVHGFDSNISVGVATPVTGIEVTPVVLGDGMSTKTINISAALISQLGPLTLTLTATGGGESHDVDVHLLIGDAPGTIDKTFGEVVFPPFGGTVPYSASRILVRPDGRVDVALFALVAGVPHTVVLQLVDGATDTSFASAGQIQLTNFALSAMAMAPDGALVLAGSGDIKSSTFLRFDAAGHPDLVFGGAPRPDAGTLANEVVDLRGANPVGVAVQSNGAVVYTHRDANRDVAAVCRLTPVGALDSAFANGAGCWWDSDGTDTLVGVALDDADAIFAGGSWRPTTGLTAFQALHLGASGKSIALWQYPAPRLAGASQSATSVAVSDGKALIAGYQLNADGSSQGAVSRALDDGVDDSFASGGALDQFGGDGTTQYNAVAVQADGKVVAVGYEAADSPSTLGVVVRYTADGVLDSSFGVDGLVTLPNAESLFGVAVAPDGRIAVVGLDQDGSPYIARLWP